MAALLISPPTAHNPLSARTPAPLIISLDGSEPEFTLAAAGVRFDLDGDGTREQTAWTIKDRLHSFVATDLNRNGRIDSGRELVGGAFGPPNGFAYLRAYDGYRTPGELANPQRRGAADGLIDALDVVFSRLIFWTDVNHDGVSQEDELQSASYARVSDIDLRYRTVTTSDAQGNLVIERSVASKRTTDGQLVLVPVSTVRLGR